jgi:hypothetical protein
MPKAKGGMISAGSSIVDSTRTAMAGGISVGWIQSRVSRSKKCGSATEVAGPFFLSKKAKKVFYFRRKLDIMAYIM